MKKATRSEEQGSQSQGQNTTGTGKPPSKIARILEHLLYRSSLQRFEAEGLGNHCLHSTISALANGYGLTFKRTPEKTPNHWGQSCDVIRYALPRNENHRARTVLDMLTRKGKKVAA